MLVPELVFLSKGGCEMHLIATYMLVAFWSILGPSDQSLLVIYVPGRVLDWTNLPQADFTCSLRHTSAFVAVNGLEFEDRTLEAILSDRDFEIGQICVDLNRIPPPKVFGVFERIRTNWTSKRRTIIFVVLFGP
jgi:hypothetical protein